MGNILRPIIESVKRSDDGTECECRVVFVDAFAPPSSSNPSRMQLLANGLRLAVRTRLEVLDKYRGVMAQERSRLAHSEDPAEALGKLHPLGGRILESLRTIVLEAELQGTKLDAPPPNLFDEDREPKAKYVRTERLLDELYRMNKEYIGIAAPTFLSMLEGSHKKPDEPGEIEGPGRPLSTPVIDGLEASTMRQTVGTLCSMIEAGALGEKGSSAPRLLR
jgi:hypothetical protein